MSGQPNLTAVLRQLLKKELRQQVVAQKIERPEADAHNFTVGQTLLAENRMREQKFLTVTYATPKYIAASWDDDGTTIRKKVHTRPFLHVKCKHNNMEWTITAINASST